jgi:hypothetical protein
MSAPSVLRSTGGAADEKHGRNHRRAPEAGLDIVDVTDASRELPASQLDTSRRSEARSMSQGNPLAGYDGGMSIMAGSNTMDPVWQRLWLRCQQHDWQSLAFIGSSKRDPEGVLEIAHGMARLASELGQELTVFDARNLGLKDMGRMLAQIQSITSRGKRCIVVLKLVTENATTVPMAQNVDAALLGVFIGETSVIAASRTVDEVGRPKFLGSVVLNASMSK